MAGDNGDGLAWLIMSEGPTLRLSPEPFAALAFIASTAVLVRSFNNSRHLRAPGQSPSQPSKATSELRAVSIAELAIFGFDECIAYSRIMTAELNRFWIKNAKWWDEGTTFLMDGAR